VKRKPSFLLLAVFPLLVFSCMAVKTLALSPAVVREPESPESVALNFNNVAFILEEWADAEGYNVTPCGPTKPPRKLCASSFAGVRPPSKLFFASENPRVDVINYSGWRIPDDLVDVLRSHLQSVFGPDSVSER